MPSRLGSEIADVQRRVPLFVEPQHALARRRRVVVRDDRLAPDLLHRHLLAARQRMVGLDEQHELVGAEQQRQQLLLRRIERQHAEVHRAQQDFLRHLPRRDAPHLDEDAGVVLLERRDQRQHGVHAGLVRADEHAPLLDVAQVGDGAGGLVDEPQEPRRRTRAALRRRR